YVGLVHTKSAIKVKRFSRWCGAEFSRRVCRLRCPPRHLTNFQNEEVPSKNNSPTVASTRDANVIKLNFTNGTDVVLADSSGLLLSILLYALRCPKSINAIVYPVTVMVAGTEAALCIPFVYCPTARRKTLRGVASNRRVEERRDTDIKSTVTFGKLSALPLGKEFDFERSTKRNETSASSVYAK
ncbi:hypothetical protein AVEN_273575-1, partial [Araneus ventricosus]